MAKLQPRIARRCCAGSVWSSLWMLPHWSIGEHPLFGQPLEGPPPEVARPLHIAASWHSFRIADGTVTKHSEDT